MAIIRMEKVDLKRLRCIAKVVGTLVTIVGAMLMTLYRGHVINLFWSAHTRPPHISFTAVARVAPAVDRDWIMGSTSLVLATFAWAAFFILQAITMRKYKAQLSLATLVCFLGTLQSIAVTFVMEHNPSAWTIGWDMNLLAAAYAGVITSGVAYYVQGVVMEKKGPVFVTGFSPFMMIIVAFMGSYILAEKIYVGGVLGAVLIVIGLYIVLWGKYKEYKEKEAQQIIPDIVKCVENANFKTKMSTISEDFELDDVEWQRNVGRSHTLFTVIVSSPMPRPPMLAMEEPKKTSNLG